MRALPLGEIADINPRSPSVAPDTQISFVGMAELSAERAVAQPRESVRFEQVAKGYTVFRDRDILAAKITPCWENGKVGQAHLASNVGAGSTEFHVVRARESADARYLMHFLRTPLVRATGELRMTGSGGQRRVPTAYLASLAVPLPSLDEQRRIAAILDHADALRAKRRQVLAHLDDLTQSIFHEMFRGAATSAWGRFRLAEIGEWRSGGTPPRGRGEHFEGDIPWFSSGELGGLYVSHSSEQVTTAAIDETSAKLVPAGSILVGMYDTAALKSSITTVDASCNQAVAFSRPDPTIADAVYVYCAIQAVRRQVLALRRGIRQKNLNLTMVRAIEIPRAPLAVQRDFADRAGDVADAQEIASRRCSLDDELFASLQSRAFKGEL